MTIETDLVDVLLASSAVTSLVSTRVTPVVVRSDTALPAVTYMRMSGERIYTLAGRSGYATVRIGMTAWAREYAQARSVADAIRGVLDAYAGAADNDIEVTRVSDGADSYDPDIDVFGCNLDIEVQYQEA